jgi:hypothetical protein
MTVRANRRLNGLHAHLLHSKVATSCGCPLRLVIARILFGDTRAGQDAMRDSPSHHGSGESLLHRGETTWQQRKRRRLAKEARRPAAHPRARAHAHARGRRQPARPRVSGSSFPVEENEKAGEIAGFFASMRKALSQSGAANVNAGEALSGISGAGQLDDSCNKRRVLESHLLCGPGELALLLQIAVRIRFDHIDLFARGDA